MRTTIDLLNQLGVYRLIPVIAVDRAQDAGPLADALLGGGLPVAEVTFRTSAAADSIREMAKRTDMLVGAGTVLDVQTVKIAVDAGAKFIVSPGFSEKVVSYCLDQKIPVIPGCVTPTEIQRALEHGLNTVKFFPAEAFGGINMIKALSGPFANVKFIPTGGITEKNLTQYLAVKSVLACGGSWMVSRELVSTGKFSEVQLLTAAAMNLAAE